MNADGFFESETIVAIATPPGRGALGVVRLSGPDALRLTEKIYRARSVGWPKPHTAFLGEIFCPSTGATIDQAVVCCYRGPQSYSGEDLVEITCHGSPVVLRQILNLLVRLGARVAKPGEFTMRAFLHGKIDLTQAEAIHDLISAETEYQTRIAIQQVQGSLAKAIEPSKSALIDLIVQLETAVEFTDEQLVEVDRNRIKTTIRDICERLRQLVRSFDSGRVIREGVRLTIVGKPNVGKSSLFNLLLSENRAIVTEVPGTTRDTLVETISLDGVPFRLVDTAGVHATTDPVELIGIERTQLEIADADVVVLMFDTSRPFDRDDQDLIQATSSARRLMVINKIDADSRWFKNGRGMPGELKNLTKISVRTGQGIPELKEAVIRIGINREKLGIEDAIITNVRHHNLLDLATAELERAGKALSDGMSEEVLLSSMHQALRHLGELTGETTVEDILQNIFSTFCVGK